MLFALLLTQASPCGGLLPRSPNVCRRQVLGKVHTDGLPPFENISLDETHIDWLDVLVYGPLPKRDFGSFSMMTRAILRPSFLALDFLALVHVDEVQGDLSVKTLKVASQGSSRNRLIKDQSEIFDPWLNPALCHSRNWKCVSRMPSDTDEAVTL